MSLCLQRWLTEGSFNLIFSVFFQRESLPLFLLRSFLCATSKGYSPREKKSFLQIFRITWVFKLWLPAIVSKQNSSHSLIAPSVHLIKDVFISGYAEREIGNKLKTPMFTDTRLQYSAMVSLYRISTLNLVISSFIFMTKIKN